MVDTIVNEMKKVKKSKKQKRTDETNGKSKKVKVNEPYQEKGASDQSFVKSFYKQQKGTRKLKQEVIDAFYKDNEMSVSGDMCEYRPIMKFKHTGFGEVIMKCCDGFKTPSPIQSQCWPILASGRDVIGIAQTGSGKTLAYGLAGILHIGQFKDAKKVCPRMLIVAPTRELAMQNEQVITAAGKQCRLNTLCIYGGVPKYEQKKSLKRGVHVIVATPGRLKDLIQEGCCDLSKVTYVVLDEADRMLDEGFEKDIRNIMSNTHPERQIAMFSATWPKSIQELAHEFLQNPVKVTCGSEDLVANSRVQQIVEVVEEYSRDGKVHALLQNYHKSRKNRVIIFVLYKKEAVRVENTLRKKGWNCAAIHGDKQQHQRIEAVNQFKSGKVPLLIATDVAARGLDIPDVEYVINYAFPLTIEDYVHRIGRTGRGGKSGISHTFFTAFDKPRAGELVNLLRESNAPVPEALTKFGTHVKKKEHKLYGAFSKDIDMTKKATKITFDDSD